MRNGGWYTVNRSELSECRKCGTLVHWRESKRTGKRYPAAVANGHTMDGYSSNRLWATHAPHKCPERMDSAEALSKQLAAKVESAQVAIDLCKDQRIDHHLIRLMITELALVMEEPPLAWTQAYDPATVERAYAMYLGA